MKVIQKKLRVLFFILGSASLGFFYTNCGRFGSSEFLVNSGEFSSMSSACEGQLINTFAVTYHPFLKANCAACHGDAQGSLDVNISFQAFMTKGQSLINYQATHAHGGNSFGPSMQTKIDVFSAQWSAGLNTYNQCLTNSSLQTVNSSFGNFTTIGKTVPTINATNFVDLSFDLDSDILTAGEKYPAILKVKVKYLTYAGINTGFIFKEPSIQLKSTTTESYQIGDIRFIVDSQPQNFVTTYIDTLLTVSGTVVTPIAPGYAAAAAYYVSPGTATKISLDVRKMGLYKPK